jgi:hypothetical protein
MSIGKQITEQLRRLSNGDQTVLEIGQEQRLVVLGTPVHASLAFFDHDRYSVTLRELTIGAGGVAPSDARGYLSATAAEEPLAVWELDGGERVAQLRSSPPLREGEEVSYWEVTLWAPSARSGGTSGPSGEAGAQVIRYRWAPGMAEREVVAYPATFALIARMADSLAEALRGDGG